MDRKQKKASMTNEDINKNMISVPLGTWTEEMMERASEKGAKKALKEHKEDCAINKIVEEVWGNSKPGLKTVVDRHETKFQQLEDVKKDAKGIMRPIIVALIVSAIFWVMQMYANSKGEVKKRPHQQPHHSTSP